MSPNGLNEISRESEYLMRFSLSLNDNIISPPLVLYFYYLSYFILSKEVISPEELYPLEIYFSYNELNSTVPVYYSESFSVVDKLKISFRPGYFYVIDAYSGNNVYGLALYNGGEIKLLYNGSVLWTK